MRFIVEFIGSVVGFIRRKPLTVISGVLAATAVFFGLLSYSFYSQNKSLQNPNKNSERQVASLIKKIDRHIELPRETPKVGTVTNIQKLQKIPFLSHARTGDKILFFVKSKKAILYRPSIDKIIEAATLKLDENITKDK